MPAILRLQEAATSHLYLRERVATPSEGNAVGLSWQQGPLSPGAIGRFLVPEPLPKRLLWAEPLRRRRAEDFGGNREKLQTNRSWCGRSSSSSSERDWSSLRQGRHGGVGLRHPHLALHSVRSTRRLKARAESLRCAAGCMIDAWWPAR